MSDDLDDLLNDLSADLQPPPRRPGAPSSQSLGAGVGVASRVAPGADDLEARRPRYGLLHRSHSHYHP
jgi:hypothetical protein